MKNLEKITYLVIVVVIGWKLYSSSEFVAALFDISPLALLAVAVAVGSRLKMTAVYHGFVLATALVVGGLLIYFASPGWLASEGSSTEFSPTGDALASGIALIVGFVVSWAATLVGLVLALLSGQIHKRSVAKRQVDDAAARPATAAS